MHFKDEIIIQALVITTKRFTGQAQQEVMGHRRMAPAVSKGTGCCCDSLYSCPRKVRHLNLTFLLGNMFSSLKASHYQTAALIATVVQKKWEQ